MRSIPLAAAATLLVGPAFGADIDAASRIDRVTVYPDAASVTRLAAVDLPVGASTIVLKGLPATVDPASIRVAGEGSQAFAIGSVETRAVPGESKPVIDVALEERIKALRERRDAAAVRIEAAEGKKAMIERYAQASPEKLSAEARPLDISQWPAAWEAVSGALATIGEELRAERMRARDLDADLAALERARPRPPQPGAPKRDILIAVEAAAAVEGALTVSYRIRGASWLPLYDARLDTGGPGGKPALELIRRAQIAQRSGEDWSDVALTVSTVRAARGTDAPDLPPARIAFYEPPIIYDRLAPKAAAAPRLESLQEKRRPDAADAASAQPAPVKAEEKQAELEAGAFQASFVVPGRVSVPQDGSPKSFRIGTSRPKPVLTVKTVPVIDETAYLEASFTNEDEAPLLPGDVTIRRDGTFVGSGRLGTVASGDKVELGFGADDQVKVKRVPLKRRENEPVFFGSTKTDLREFKTSVKNLHSFPLRIAVVDRVPFSESTAITVEILPQTTPATEKIVDDKRGVMSWSFDYAPGEQKEIKLAYRLKWPADREVMIDGLPGPIPLGAR